MIVHTGDMSIIDTIDEKMPMLVTLKRVADLCDCHRTTVRRQLGEAGIQPVALTHGPKGTIRYVWAEIEQWLTALPRVR